MEPWLREKEGAWITSPQLQGAYELTVNDLMHQNVKEWNKGKIVALFPMHLVNRIVDIPLFGVNEQDKSGYNSLLKSTWNMAGAIYQEDWNKLWSIHAPPNAKHLLW
jgi:hypothetical protein